MGEKRPAIEESPGKLDGLTWQALAGLVQLILILGVLLFVPAWSLSFWQGWLFLTVFSACVLAITVYFLRRDPSLIRRRIKAGAVAEHEGSQKIIQALASLIFVAIFVTAGIDHRFGWSAVPAALIVVGDIGVAAGLYLVFLVFRENSFAAATIEVSAGQQAVSTGPYRLVRHPMYAGALVMLLFTPLALGSYAALL